MKSYKRHLIKTFTWRFIATADTILIAFLLTGDFTKGIKIGLFEIFSKMLLYFIHERLWFNSKFHKANLRHLLKTFSWRFIGTSDTILIGWIISGSLNIGLQIGTIEILTKIILYFIHERIWYSSNLYLEIRKNKT